MSSSPKRGRVLPVIASSISLQSRKGTSGCEPTKWTLSHSSACITDRWWEFGPKGDAFISTRSEACAISADFMQICHRHKSTAVHGLTFLFVTSKHSSVSLFSLLFGSVDKCLSSKRRKNTSRLFFTCFPHHWSINIAACLDFWYTSLFNLDLLHREINGP